MSHFDHLSLINLYISSSSFSIFGEVGQVREIGPKCSKSWASSIHRNHSKCKLHIWHQMKPYSSLKAIWGSICTCFCVFVELGQVKEIWPKYPKSWAAIHVIQVLQSVEFNISNKMKYCSRVNIVGTLRNFQKLNHVKVFEVFR